MKKNLITGIVVIVTLVLLYFGLNFLKGRNLFERDYEFHTIYANVDGLQVANPVLIRGKKVGEVQRVDFTDEKAEKLLVSFSVSMNYKIPRGTVAQIVTTSIMGGRSLKLNFPAETTNGYLVSGDTLQGGTTKGLKEEVSAQVLPIKAKAEQLMSSMDSILIAARAILGEESQKNLVTSIKSMRKTFKNLETTTGHLNEVVLTEKKNMGSILQNFASISENLEKNNDKISMILGNVSSFTDTLTRADFAGTLIEAQQAIQQFSAMVNKIEKGEGTIGALLNDEQLYNNLEAATANMNRLMTDFRLNPKKYVNFSLLKTGRTVYYDSPNPVTEQGFYRIQIYHSKGKVDLSNPIFKNHKDIVEIQKDKGDYLYTIGYTSDYKKLQKLLKKVRKDFPEAYIIEDKR